VIDHLRAFLNRPLGDGERWRLFVLAVIVILAGAGALALLDRPAPRPQLAMRAPTPGPSPAAPPAAAQAGDQVSLEAPSEEGSPRKELGGSRADVASAKRAAARFLAGYLPYSYGRRSARRIASASDALRRRLAANRPRIPARERRRHPRVVLVQSNGVGRVGAELVALVRDGARQYTILLELVGRHGVWKVTAVGS
jgi:hypothetical protein